MTALVPSYVRIWDPVLNGQESVDYKRRWPPNRPCLFSSQAQPPWRQTWHQTGNGKWRLLTSTKVESQTLRAQVRVSWARKLSLSFIHLSSRGYMSIPFNLAWCICAIWMTSSSRGIVVRFNTFYLVLDDAWSYPFSIFGLLNQRESPKPQSVLRSSFFLAFFDSLDVETRRPLASFFARLNQHGFKVRTL